MKRKLPSERQRGSAGAFTKPMTSKNSFPPIDVQAASTRTNDKPTSKPRKSIIEEGSGA